MQERKREKITLFGLVMDIIFTTINLYAAPYPRSLYTE